MEPSRDLVLPIVRPQIRFGVVGDRRGKTPHQRRCSRLGYLDEFDSFWPMEEQAGFLSVLYFGGLIVYLTLAIRM